MNQAHLSVAGLQSDDELLRFELLLADVSSRFIELPTGRIDEAISEGLREIVTTIGIDRSTLLHVDSDTGRVQSTHSWAAPGSMPFPTADVSQAFPWVLARMRAGLPAAFSRPDELPPEAALDAASYARIGLRSHVAVPVMVSGELVAVLTFGTLHHDRSWPDGLVRRMQLLGSIFGNALARKRVQDRIDRLLEFERLLADLSASLVGSAAADVDAKVNDALRGVGTLLSVDRCALWVLVPARAGIVATHHWFSADVAAPREELGLADIPWILGQIVAGNVVNVAAVTDLPPAAGTDIAALGFAGIRSLLTVPMRANDAVVGALSLSCMRDERIWTEDMVPRLRLFGKLLLNALAHRDAQRSVLQATAQTAAFRERLAHLARVDAVGAMSAAVAHEINQPLMAIANYAQAGRRRLVGSGPVDLARLAGLLGKIGDQAALASEVLDRLRAMVRRREPDEVEIDMALLLNRTLKLVEMEGRMKDVSIETSVEPDLPRALGDEIQIQQVILNLAHNAMEAMAAVPVRARALRLEASASPDGLILIRVADRGPGIARADDERIFEAFYTTKAAGLGIGLAICRAIVDAHGGKLWHAPNESGGTVFQFSLPVASERG